jgi:arylsulfatase A-like enzyme
MPRASRPPRKQRGRPLHERSTVKPQQKEDEQKRYDDMMAIYAAMIDQVDKNVGKLVAALRERGQLDNTLINAAIRVREKGTFYFFRVGDLA